jgi:hypothetical protein
MLKVAEYKKNADDCRKMAANTSNPQLKQRLQEMAAAWETLAIEREKQLEAKE